MGGGLGLPKCSFPSLDTEILVSNFEILGEAWRLGAAVGEQELAVQGDWWVSGSQLRVALSPSRNARMPAA
jgi:hypothetical protein